MVILKYFIEMVFNLFLLIFQYKPLFTFQGTHNKLTKIKNLNLPIFPKEDIKF